VITKYGTDSGIQWSVRAFGKVSRGVRRGAAPCCGSIVPLSSTKRALCCLAQPSSIAACREMEAWFEEDS